MQLSDEARLLSLSARIQSRCNPVFSHFSSFVFTQNYISYSSKYTDPFAPGLSSALTYSLLNPTRCRMYVKFPGATQIVSNIATGVTLMLRTYALYGRATVSLVLQYFITGTRLFEANVFAGALITVGISSPRASSACRGSC